MANWEIYEKMEDKDGVNEWSLFVLMKGAPLNNTASPYRKGYWFFGKDGGDPAGEKFYIEGLKDTEAEVERLNRLGRSPR